MSITRHPPKSHIKVQDERNVEWFMVANDMIDEWAAQLTHATFKVYIALCRYANNGPANLAYKTLCARLDMSSASVARAMQQLEGQGLIRVEHNKNERGVALNTYTLLALPVTSLSEATPTGDFTEQSHPASTSEVTPLHSVKRVLKNEENKEEEIKRPPSPTLLRLQQRERERQKGRR